MTELAVVDKAGRKEWIGLAVLVLPLLLVSMDMTVLYFAVPFISADLEPTGPEQLWMIDIYGFVLAGLLVTMGTLGDRIGRRLLLTIGAAAFGAASVAAAFAISPEMLIASRAVQGIGGATLMPSTLALIRNMFHDEKQRRTAVAVWSASLSGGAALGPVVSGVLLGSTGWWGSIFLINVPFLLLLLITGPILLSEYRHPQPGKFDLISVVMSLATVLPVIYGLKELVAEGFEPIPLGALALGVVVGGFFLRRQAVRPDPMIDLNLFRNRGFGPSITINMVCFFAMIGFGVLTTQYLQEVLNMDPLAAALWTMPGPIVGGFVAPLAATILATMVRPAYLIAAGFVVAAGGLGVMTQIQIDSSVWIAVLGSGLIAVGISTVLTLITDLVVGSAPPEKAGAASALVQTGQEFGGALGIAVLGSVSAAVYSSKVTSEVIPEGLPEDLAEAARSTLGGAEAAAHQLTTEAAAALLRTSRLAFVESMHAAGITGVVVVVVAAIMALVFLRHIKEVPKDDEQPVADETPTVMFQAIRATTTRPITPYGYGPTGQYAYTPPPRPHAVPGQYVQPPGAQRQFGYPPAQDAIQYPPGQRR